MPIVKNDNGCCEFTAPAESEVVVIEKECNTGCTTEPSNTCGLTHPKGSGTLAGCKSTTLPHFGVVMGKKAGCRTFGYYTSGNTEEYENECGSIDRLTHTVETMPCEEKVVLSVESCDCFDSKDEQDIKDAEQDAGILANVDNTVIKLKESADGNNWVNVLEDGTEVVVRPTVKNLAGEVVG